MQKKKSIIKIVNHSATVLKIAVAEGWLPGARYTNLRDVRKFSRLGLLDIDWKNYDFSHHIEAAQETQPLITVARDLEHKRDLKRTIDQAYRLMEFAKHVIVVPKDPLLEKVLSTAIPDDFILGFSVPTKYGGTKISPHAFSRPVHLLGGRPDVQRQLGRIMPIFSVDTNRFTLDATFGDYFDGEKFRPHPKGGYKTCIRDSVRNINLLWRYYRRPKSSGADNG